MLIINADDWGGWPSATDAALQCFQNGCVTSASAMVFMADSERASGIAKECGIDVGLHLNFSQQLTGSTDAYPLLDGYHRSVVRFLQSNKYALLLYHPFLRQQFHYLVAVQIDEFIKLYGKPPSHFNGHQHMHLCSNLLIDGIIPKTARVRRCFSFFPGEKCLVNRAYRGMVDKLLSRRYRVSDYFFSLSQQIQWKRIDRVLELSRSSIVELMVHPEWPNEYDCLQGDSFASAIKKIQAVTWSQAIKL